MPDLGPLWSSMASLTALGAFILTAVSLRATSRRNSAADRMGLAAAQQRERDKAVRDALADQKDNFDQKMLQIQALHAQEVSSINRLHELQLNEIKADLRRAEANYMYERTEKDKANEVIRRLNIRPRGRND